MKIVVWLKMPPTSPSFFNLRIGLVVLSVQTSEPIQAMEKNDHHLVQFQPCKLLILHGLNADVASHFGLQPMIKEGNEGAIKW